MPSTADHPWVRSLCSPVAAALVLLLFYGALLASLGEKSATFDEPGHATAGYTYWKFNDYRIDPENGNLPQRWLALPLLWGDFPFPAASFVGRQPDTWTLSDEWFNRTGNDDAAMLARGRAVSGLVAVALGALVWFWSRRLFGPVGGMLSLLLYVVSPAILAHGALMKDDLPGALFFLAACGAFWAMLRKFSVPRVLLSASAMGALFITKASAVLVVPMVLLLLAVHLLGRRPLLLGNGPPVPHRRGQFLLLGSAAAVHVVVIFGMIWAAYGFRYSATPVDPGGPTLFGSSWEWTLNQPHHIDLLNRLQLTPEQEEKAGALLDVRGVRVNQWSPAAVETLDLIRDRVLTPEQAARLAALRREPPSALTPRLIFFAREHRLLPEAYLFGYAHVWRLSSERGAFLNGEFGIHGWWWFFPYTFLVKTPLAFLVLLVLAGTVLLRRGRASADPLPLLVLSAVYGAVALLSHINIGHRHLLPLYPALFILCGVLAAPARGPDGSVPRRRWWTFATVGLLGVCVVEAAWWFPDYLPYFNGVVSPAQGYRHLVDSSLDWGQELPAIRTFVDRQPAGTRTYLAYFGTGSPKRHGIAANQVYGYPGYDLIDRPPFVVVNGITPEANRDRVDAFLRREPDYDPLLVSRVDFDDKAATLFVHRASTLQWKAGTYLISATLLQPVYSRATGPWNPDYEAAYQRLAALFRPLLSDDVGLRASALEKLGARDWQRESAAYREYRFARLTAFLRKREPDTEINYSILVYHLTDADLVQALEGPSP